MYHSELKGAGEYPHWKIDNLMRSLGVDTEGNTSATTFEYIVVTAASFTRNQDNSFTPPNVVIYAKQKAPDVAPVDFLGRFIVYESYDRVNYTAVYTSSADESQHTHTPSANMLAMKVELYNPGMVLLDTKTIPVTVSGVNGTNTATVYIYQRSATTPSVPSSTVTYAFATGAVTGLTNGWTTSVPTGTNPLYVSIAYASGDGATDTIATSEWSAPTILAQDGANGANVAVVYIYQRAASTPSLPSATVTYTFATGAFSGLTNGWQGSVPAANGNPLYVSTAVANSSTATASILSTAWASPTILAQDGAQGPTGAAAVVYSVSPSTSNIVRDETGSISPSSVTFSFFNITGSTQTAYAGRWKIYETNDGVTWTLTSTATSDATSTVYSPTPTVLGVKCELYLAGGTTTLLAWQTVMVVTDGTFDYANIGEWKTAIIEAGGISLDKAGEEGAVLNGTLVADNIGAGTITALVQLIAPIIDLQGAGAENSMRLDANGLVIRDAAGNTQMQLSIDGMTMNGVQTITNDTNSVTIDSYGVHVGARDDNGNYTGANSQLLASMLQFLYQNEVRVEIGSDATSINKALLSGGTVIQDSLCVPDTIAVGVDGSTSNDLVVKRNAGVVTIDWVI
jgi:hypothetical protein